MCIEIIYPNLTSCVYIIILLCISVINTFKLINQSGILHSEMYINSVHLYCQISHKIFYWIKKSFVHKNFLKYLKLSSISLRHRLKSYDSILSIVFRLFALLAPNNFYITCLSNSTWWRLLKKQVMISTFLLTTVSVIFQKTHRTINFTNLVNFFNSFVLNTLRLI